MTIANFTPLSGFIGGALIGLSVFLLFWLNGRIAGISGIVAGTMGELDDDARWRWLFIAGMLAAALAWAVFSPGGVPVDMEAGTLRAILGGLLVGFGARLGCGCTSGHGIAGIARFSMRSLVAVATFFIAALITATLTGLLIGNGGAS